MSSLFFWKDWSKHYRSIAYIALGVFIFSLLFLWFGYFQGPNGVMHWERIQEQKVVETTVHQFNLGPFELHIPGESYVIFEYLHGSPVTHNITASCIFLFILAVCSCLLLTVITTLEKLWYYAGMGLFILFVVSLRLEVLDLFYIHSIYVPVVVLLLYVVPAFYFKSFRPSTSFPARLIFFLSLTLALGITIYFFSAAEFPMIHMAVTAYTSALILSVLFILMVAHEIVASFVYVASQGSSKSLRHFLIISAIYLANVLIAALHEIGTINWDFIYINLYLLLSISAVLGIWGFRQRESQYENIISFHPFGFFLFLGLGAICFATTGQLLGNANDASLKIIRDIIIFSHAGFGIIFLTYVISNFVVMMAKNIPVHRLLYRPHRMPYFSYNLAGLIAMLAFIFYSNWREYVYHGLGGFYIYAADLYSLQGNDAFAESFYEQGRNYAFQNNRANYALGTLKGSRFNFDDAHYNYELGNDKRPTEFSLANDGNLFLWERNYFKAIETYRKGLKVMPGSAVLPANLAFAYSKVHRLDSAAYYISEAREHHLTRSTAEINFFAMAAAETIPVNTDSVVKLFDSSSPAVISNALALATLMGQTLDMKLDPLKEKSLDLFSATLLNNYIIRNARTLDTTFTKEAYRIASDSVNTSFSEALKASLAYGYYHQGNVYKALEILGELAYISQDYQGKFNYIMGLWALEQDNPEIASSYFTYAIADDYKDAKLYNAIALTEAGKVQNAVVAWDTVAQSDDAERKEMAARIQKILTLDSQDALALDDAEKYQFCRYRLGKSDTILFNRLANTFTNTNYKAQALLDMARRQYKADNMTSAIWYINRISGLELTDKKLYENVRHTELRMLASRREVRSLAQQINQGLTFEGSRSLDKMLYTALISESSADMATAKRYYEIVGKSNPYFEEGIMAAANFFRNQNQSDLKAYNILVEAIHVNSNSIRLLKAYAAEAARMGFEEFAISAAERASVLEAAQR
ncbi:MAG: tetratricopeptide repeat protein [Bacteroidota bacterium]